MIIATAPPTEPITEPSTEPPTATTTTTTTTQDPNNHVMKIDYIDTSFEITSLNLITGLSHGK